MKLSIIIPIFNEEDNLVELLEKISKVLSTLGLSYEIIAINDGSTDGSIGVLSDFAKNDNKLKIIDFRTNFGQTAAISAGINSSTGDVIIPIDSDLENDPEDIPRLLEKINEGYDVVSGWRKKRWGDKMLTRKLPSVMANRIISKITKVKLHDYGCTLKAYRSEVLKDVNLYGEMHRFIPVYAAWHGAKVTEIEVNYSPRKHGESKYNLFRIPKVILDLITVKFLSDYFTKPMYFFGRFGFWMLFFSALSFLLAIYLRLFNGIHLILTPLPLFAVLFALMGMLFVLMGLLAEIIIRIYHESQSKEIYYVRSKINFDSDNE